MNCETDDGNTATEPIDRGLAIDVADILNDLYNDLSSAGGIYYSLVDGVRKGLITVRPEMIDRVLIGHVVITLAKVHEVFVHPHYARVMGRGEVDWRRAYRKEVDRRQILQFRNTCLGHIHCDARGRPVRNSELVSMLRLVLDKDIRAFMSWVMEGDTSVRSKVCAIRDDVLRCFKIAPGEILDR